MRITLRSLFILLILVLSFSSLMSDTKIIDYEGKTGFKERSGGILWGKRNLIKPVDDALKAYHKYFKDKEINQRMISEEMNLLRSIADECKNYIENLERKTSKRRAIVEMLYTNVNDRIEELEFQSDPDKMLLKYEFKASNNFYNAEDKQDFIQIRKTGNTKPAYLNVIKVEKAEKAGIQFYDNNSIIALEQNNINSYAVIDKVARSLRAKVLPDKGELNWKVTFLPFLSGHCTSIKVREDSKFFFSSQLSGCYMYVAQKKGDQPVVMHSNSGQDVESDRTKKVKSEMAKLLLAKYYSGYAFTNQAIHKTNYDSGFVFGKKNDKGVWTFYIYNCQNKEAEIKKMPPYGP